MSKNENENEIVTLGIILIILTIAKYIFLVCAFIIFYRYLFYEGEMRALFGMKADAYIFLLALLSYGCSIKISTKSET